MTVLHKCCLHLLFASILISFLFLLRGWCNFTFIDFASISCLRCMHFHLCFYAFFCCTKLFIVQLLWRLVQWVLLLSSSVHALSSHFADFSSQSFHAVVDAVCFQLSEAPFFSLCCGFKAHGWTPLEHIGLSSDFPDYGLQIFSLFAWRRMPLHPTRLMAATLQTWFIVLCSMASHCKQLSYQCPMASHCRRRPTLTLARCPVQWQTIIVDSSKSSSYLKSACI